MFPLKPNKRITFQTRPTQPRARNMEKGCAMIVDCMDMSGLCVHTRVGPTKLKPPIKRLLPRNAQCTKKQERKPKLQLEDAMGAMRWATRLIDVHTSKSSIEHTKAAYAMLVEERGI